ncbi:MAG: PKD domain-containing protein [Pyrinomonadaceae bacterium]
MAFIVFFTQMSPARAELNQSIDLTLTDGLMPQRQTDFRWAGFPVGPYIAEPKINMGSCGCFLTSLSTALVSMVGDDLGNGSVPWFSTYLNYPNQDGFKQFTTLNPEYVNEFLTISPLNATRPLFWGYVPSSGVSCGVQLKPWAANYIARPQIAGGVLYTPSGLSWDTLGWNSYARDQVDEGLLKGWPSIVTRRSTNGGFHANLIVGWDNTEKRYLIYDPMWKTDFLAGGGVNHMGYAFTGATPAEQYTNYQAAIENVKPLRHVFLETKKSRWLTIFDDPEPIELRLTDSRGRVTGYDPASGKNLQENPSAYYSEFTSWADPLGQLPEAAPLRYIAARDPEAGVYGLEVFGTGTGPFTLTLGTVDGDDEQNVVTLTGNVTNGAIKRYEITYSTVGTATVAEVAAFGPHARAGNDYSGYVGTPVTFDGRGSSQINGTITGYSWSFGDGATGSGAQQTHAYTTPGSYLATLTVTNAAGLTNSDERTVLIAVPGSVALKETIRVSVTGANAQANDHSGEAPQVTPDGRYVVFESDATNFVANDTNAMVDIFVKDLSTGAIERVNVATNGTQANNYSRSPAISADGRFVSFFSSATNLGAIVSSLYVHDRATGTTEIIARTDNSVEPASFSADGRYIAFRSTYQLLPPGGYGDDIYVRDRQLGTLERVSTYKGYDPRISADGRFVTYWAPYGPDALDSNGDKAGVYLRDRQNNTDELISRSSSGLQISNHSFNPSISADGRFVAFEVNVLSSDLNVGHPTARPDVFLRDRLMGITEQINTGSFDTAASFQPIIGASGRYVAFLSAPDLNSVAQIYVRDRQAGTTEMVSVATDGTPASGGVTTQPLFSGPAVSSEGGVVFISSDPTLVADDTNGKLDVFLRRLVPGSGSGSTTPLANLRGPYLGWATSVEVPTGVRLDGGGSVDPSSRPLNGHWDFGDGSPVADGALVVTHAYAKPGIYQVTLTVNSGTDISAAVRTEVEVLPSLPSSALSIDACVAPGGTLSLEGAAPGVNTTLIASGWDMSTGPVQSAPVTLTFPWGQMQLPTMLPSLTFQGTVAVPSATTNGGYSAVVTNGLTKSFNVPCGTLANRPPLAVAGGPIYQAVAGVPLMLNGSSSSDPENAPLTYRWDFGDETTGSTVTPTHTYAVKGTYFVTLVVNDGVQDSAMMIGTRSFALVEVTAATPTPTSVQFSAASYAVTEGCIATNITVIRSGDLIGTSTVVYTIENGTATQRGDFTFALGRLDFAAGETSKSFPVLINDDGYAEGVETATLKLSVSSGLGLGIQSTATLIINDDETVDSAANPIDNIPAYVAHKYHDFLNRQADADGQAFWENQIASCGSNAACIDDRRQNVSAAFFISIEFQNTGYFVFRHYRASFLESAQRPRALPRYAEFLRDTQEIGRGVVVGQGNWEAQLETNRQSFARRWVQRADFIAGYPESMSRDEYINQLFARSEVTPSTAERDGTRAAYDSGSDTPDKRARALRFVVDSGSVYNKQYNSAFVLLQYFGYLRRNADGAPDNSFAGYDFWLNKLNEFSQPDEDLRDERVALSRVKRAEMIKAFIVSIEYRARFGGDPSRGTDQNPTQVASAP